MQISCKRNVREIEGKPVHIYILTNKNGMEVKITNYGGIILSACVPDRCGKLGDVILGYDDIDEYIRTRTVHGSMVGRYANRIGKATFKIDDVQYFISKNDNGNHLHGGYRGFHCIVWDSEIISDSEGQHLSLHYLSKDGEEGFPGNLDLNVVYTLREDNAIVVNYKGITDKDTIVNLTNHAFFNLSAVETENVLDHTLRIDADAITVVDAELIPTGELMDVTDTPFDFRTAPKVGKNIFSDHPQMKMGNGYDHNFALNHGGDIQKPVIELADPYSGRVMTVYTTKPGVQLYSGNGFDGSEIGKQGKRYMRFAGLCLETQFFPDSVNHPNFQSPILRANERYDHTTVYQFSVQ